MARELKILATKLTTKSPLKALQATQIIEALLWLDRDLITSDLFLYIFLILSSSLLLLKTLIW